MSEKPAPGQIWQSTLTGLEAHVVSVDEAGITVEVERNVRGRDGAQSCEKRKLTVRPEVWKFFVRPYGLVD